MTDSTPANLLPDDPASLDIVLYPDPRLRRRSVPVETFTDEVKIRLRGLVERMYEVMHEQRGIGLAAPQVGVNVRLFVMNDTGEPANDRVYVNPRLCEPTGEEEGEEGCLSLPKINTPVWRSQRLRIEYEDLEGQTHTDEADGLIARCWQHEVDHLDGVLLLDKMPMTVRMAHRKQIKALEEQYAADHPQPEPVTPQKRKDRAKARKRR